MADAASPVQSVYGPCVIQSLIQENNLSLSHSSLKASERRDIFECWAALRISHLGDHGRQETFQCPFCLCRLLFHDARSAIRHSYSCTQWHCGQHGCDACNQFDDFRKSTESSHLLSSGSILRSHDIATDLTSIGGQFAEAERPQHIDISESLRGYATGSRVFLSATSHDLQQPNRTSIAFLDRGPRSDYGFRPTTVAARSVRSDSDLDKSLTVFQTTSLRPDDTLIDAVSRRGRNSHPEDFIVRLCGLVVNSHLESLRLIATSPDVTRSLSDYSLDNVFERGLTTLQKFYGPRSPSEFEDIYCFVHVVLASVCVLHQHGSYDYDALVVSLMRLGYNINNENGRGIYPHVLSCVFQAQPSIPNAAKTTVSELAQNDSRTMEKYVCPDCPWSLRLNGKEKALREVEEMLDKFDSTYILANRSRLAWTSWSKDRSFANAQLIVENVFEPLRRDLGLRMLNIYSIQKALEEGTLLNPREAEIMLISQVISSIQNSSRRASAVGKVNSLFNRAMKNSSWRDRYFVASIDGMLATAFKVNECRKKSWNGGRPYPDLLCSSHSKASLLTASSSQPSIPHSSTRRIHKTRSLAPLPSSRSSSRKTSISLSVASREELLAGINDYSRCPICNQEFKKIADQKHNLTRHINTQHGEFEPFKCPHPNCERGFLSKYNCDRHARTHHPNPMSPTDLLSPGYPGEEKSGTHAQGLSRSRSQ